MRQPYFSVITPVYMVEPYLRVCVDSILKQTFTDFELILVNDGSPDHCPGICDEYAFIDSRIRVIHKNNEGVVLARNAAMEIAQGVYIVFVDSDDWIDPDMLELYHNTIKQEDVDMVISRSNYLEDRDNTVLQQYPVLPGVYFARAIAKLSDDMLYSGRFYEYYVNPALWGKAFKREFLVPNINLVDPQICVGEDLCCIYACLLDADSICVCDGGQYHYRKSCGSSTKYRSGYIENVVRLYSFLERLIREREGDEAVAKLNYSKVYSAYMGVAYILSPKNKKSWNKKMNEIKQLLELEIYQTALAQTRVETQISRVRKWILSAMRGNHRYRLCIYIYIEKLLVKTGIYLPKNGV